MRRLVATFLCLLTSALAAQAPRPDVVAVLREFDRISAAPLWPGFTPGAIAVEVYDGTSTYLAHHPRPPAGFTPVAGAPGVLACPGRHESVRANTGTELAGVPTATADLSRSTATVREQAALLVHEAFHVYEKQAHPGWAANEAELFVYPLEDAELLALRREETTVLTVALQAEEAHTLRCRADQAVRLRRRRAAAMPAGAAAYERGTELHEGLAQYVEHASIGAPPALTRADFPLEQVRQRGYATGEAWAVLLDRLDPGWKARGGDTPLDERAAEAVAKAPLVCSQIEAPADLAAAQREVAALTAQRRERRESFLSAPGWRLEIVAGKEPLWPQAFDPWNVQMLGGAQVLHTRWLKLGNGAGALEALGRTSLTEGIGPHPLFNGARRVVLTGLPEPRVTATDGKVTIEGDGIKGAFTGTVERTGQRFVVRLPIE